MVIDWVSLALAVVKLGLAIFEKFQDRAKEKIGEDREKLKQFTAMHEVSSKLKEVDERFANMTDAQVKAEIEAQGDFRD